MYRFSSIVQIVDEDTLDGITQETVRISDIAYTLWLENNNHPVRGPLLAREICLAEWVRRAERLGYTNNPNSSFAQ